MTLTAAVCLCPVPIPLQLLEELALVDSASTLDPSRFSRLSFLNVSCRVDAAYLEGLGRLQRLSFLRLHLCPAIGQREGQHLVLPPLPAVQRLEMFVCADLTVRLVMPWLASLKAAKFDAGDRGSGRVQLVGGEPGGAAGAPAASCPLEKLELLLAWSRVDFGCLPALRALELGVMVLVGGVKSIAAATGLKSLRCVLCVRV